jgi:predicted RNA-binding protein with PUA-like domain
VAKEQWLVKTEPSEFSWDDLVREKRSVWDGVRSFEARNHLRRMKKGDLVLIYHSNPEKRIVGLARVWREAYADPRAAEGDWSAVDVEPVKPLKQAVTLAQIKSDEAFADFHLVRRARLSVMPVSASQFQRILRLAATKP